MNAENKRKVYEYLTVHPCVDCGMTDVRVLEFDHVSGEKRANITRLLAQAIPWTGIEAEIARCEVRCANCHRLKTYERSESWRHFLSSPG